MGKNSKLNVCVMFGGRSVEHDISIISGLQVYNALNKDKYDVTILYITKDNIMLTGKCLSDIKSYQNGTYYKKTKEVRITNAFFKTYLTTKFRKKQIDCFIPVVHGKGTEDGTISSLLDFYNATYITSNKTSSSIAQDKVFTKDILKKYHISTPRYMAFKKGNITDITSIINQKLNYPIIIKPSKLGSSIGIYKVDKEEDTPTYLNEAFKFDDKVIVEEVIIDKIEYNCACFKYNNHIYTSNIEEVHTSNDFLTFDDKYLDNVKSNQNKRNINPLIDDALKEHIKSTTKDIYQILDFEGIIRVDYLYDYSKHRLYFNEVNTIPGSFAFYLFDKEKLSFDIILDILIKEALLNKQRKNKQINVFQTNVLKNNNKILKK